MQEPKKLMTNEAQDAWVKETTGRAVKELTAQGVLESVLVEAKPAWAFPGQILIGKVRDQGDRTGFYWFIAGMLPTDCIASSVAPTARDAARHFSLKWQLEAARKGEEGEELARQAEGLYELTDQPELWKERVG